MYFFTTSHKDNVISEVIKKWQQSNKTALTSDLQTLKYKKIPAFCLFLSSCLIVIFLTEGKEKFKTVLRLIL